MSSFLGDVGDFETFNLGAMGNQVAQNPARLFYGSADPFSTGMWNKVLGTNDQPLVDQWGGAAPQRYQEAQDAGINTGPGHAMHNIAKTIASAFAGGEGSQALGGLLGSGAGAGAGAGSAGASGTTAAADSAAAASSGAGSAAGGAGASSAGAGYGLGQPLVTGSMGNSALAQSPGLLSQVGSALSSMNSTLKPYSDAAGYAKQAYGLLNQATAQQPMQQGPAIHQNNSGPQTLMQIAQQPPNPLIAQRQQYMQQRRMQGGY
jgi:hypothetical protein